MEFTRGFRVTLAAPYLSLAIGSVLTQGTCAKHSSSTNFEAAVLAAGTAVTIGIGYLLGRTTLRRRILPRRVTRALPRRAA